MLPRSIPLILALAALAPALRAQQRTDVSSLPMVVGHGTQGFVVYRGPAIPNLFWSCFNGSSSSSIGEVAEDVHMLQAGDLASITFAYHVEGAIGQSGTCSAILRVYANNATNSVTPPAGLIASYTVPGLPWATATNHTATFDIPVPIAVPQHLWLGVEIVSPSGTYGSVLGAESPGENPAPNLGTSFNVTWFGPASCTAPPGELLDNGAEFGSVINYTVLVRVFPPVDCPDAIANGDFETGVLGPWTNLGRTGVITAEASATVPPSGGYQGFADTGFVYASSGLLQAPVGTLESSLGLGAGTLSALTVGGPVTHGSALAQTLSVGAGDVLQFHWNFQTNELTPAGLSNDFAFFTVASNGAVLLADTFFPSFVDSASPYSDETGYQAYSYTFPAAGTFTVGWGVADRQTTSGDSALLIDCVERIPGAPVNQPPACSVDLDVARQDFLEPVPNGFVVTEGETITVQFTGTDPEGGLLVAEAPGIPFGSSVSPGAGPAPLVSTFQWTPSSSDKAGAPYTIAVAFRDPAGAVASCDFGIVDVNLRPVASASDQTVESTSQAGALVTLDGSATDADDPAANLVYQWFVSDASVVLSNPASPTPTGLFPVGVTMATLTVADGRGGVDVHDALITVEDTRPPEVWCTTDQAALWPANHAMIPVRVYVGATDDCSAPGDILPITVRVSSSEPDNASGNGDGNTNGDVHGFDGYAAPVNVTSSFTYDAVNHRWGGTVRLRAERAGGGAGRKYTIDVVAQDSHGNTAVTSCCVVVPHDRRGSADCD